MNYNIIKLHYKLHYNAIKCIMVIYNICYIFVLNF